MRIVQNSLIVAALALIISCQSLAAAADDANAGKVPPIVPAADEMPVRGVALFSVHQELQKCLKDAAALLDGGPRNALHARIGTTQTYFSQTLGYILRADFSRNDVPPPLINRILCWHTGQLIASRISAPPLPPEDAEKALAVPRSHPPRN